MDESHYGRIDVHSHLLPGIDDGCRTTDESLGCAWQMVQAGYTHSFCTPHVWPDLPDNNAALISRRVADLQKALDAAAIPLRLMPGGEIGLRPHTLSQQIHDLVSYGMEGRHCLVDYWGDSLPPFFEKAVGRLQSLGVKVILAHPERMQAVQNEPSLVGRFMEMGLLLQGNLQCLDDPADAPTRRIIERELLADRYFLLGSDLHNLHSLDCRLRGLQRAVDLVGNAKVLELTRSNPAQLLSR